MKKRNLFSFLFQQVLLEQQQKKIDSLKVVFKSEKHDTSKVNLLTELTIAYQNSNLDECMKSGKKALAEINPELIKLKDALGLDISYS